MSYPTAHRSKTAVQKHHAGSRAPVGPGDSPFGTPGAGSPEDYPGPWNSPSDADHREKRREEERRRVSDAARRARRERTRLMRGVRGVTGMTPLGRALALADLIGRIEQREDQLALALLVPGFSFLLDCGTGEPIDWWAAQGDLVACLSLQSGGLPLGTGEIGENQQIISLASRHANNRWYSVQLWQRTSEGVMPAPAIMPTVIRGPIKPKPEPWYRTRPAPRKDPKSLTGNTPERDVNGPVKNTRPDLHGSTPSVAFDGVRGQGLRLRPGHKYARPKPGDKEKKVFVRLGGTTVGAVINGLTESNDAIQAVYDAIGPVKVRRNGRIVTLKRPPKHLRPSSKVAFIYRHWRDVDAEQAVRNLVINQIEDLVIGKLSSTAQKAAKRHLDLLKRPAGFGTGPAL